MQRVMIETYGCTLNQADSEIMESILKNNGFDVTKGKYQDSCSADYVIVNTCTVKMPTEQRILERLKTMRSFGKRLIVTGCISSANSGIILKTVPEASILNTSNVVNIAEAIYCINQGEKAHYGGYKPVDKAGYLATVGSVISKIPVSEGCLSNCGFCETKFARGPLNSFSEELILNAIKINIQKGAREIDLTSQDTGAYGADKKTNIAELVLKAIQIDGDFKIRIGMLNPEHLHKYFDSLIECYKSDKLYKFIHLPVQSGSNKVLRDMKRKYLIESVESYIVELRRKINRIAIETDIIVGYPAESETDFKDTLGHIERTMPSFTNISKFGKRQHTIASRMEQLPNHIVNERCVRLARTVRRIQYRDMSELVGKKISVLFTEKNNRSFTGRDDSYRAVAVDEAYLNIGDRKFVEVVDNSYACLIGKVV